MVQDVNKFCYSSWKGYGPHEGNNTSVSESREREEDGVSKRALFGGRCVLMYSKGIYVWQVSHENSLPRAQDITTS
jgi:hypothetical protein